MLDIRWIRDNPEVFDRALARRGLPPVAASILERDREWRAAQTSAEQLQAERNRLAKEIGAAKAKGGDASALLRRWPRARTSRRGSKPRRRGCSALIDEALAPHAEPAGGRRAGRAGRDRQPPRPQHGTPPQLPISGEGPCRAGRSARHDGFRPRRQALGRALRRAERAASPGSSARSDRSCSISTRREFGYTEIAPPLLVRDETAYGTGQLPEIRRRSLPHDDGPVAHPDRRGAADQPRRRRDARGGRRCRCATPRGRRASAPRRAPPARTRAA